MYLGVHEGPGKIQIGYRPNNYESSLHAGMFFSDEPGYYEDGKFGVRLETIVMVEEKNTPHQFGGVKYLGFDYFTLVPFEPNLIAYELLTPAMRRWLNEYNSRTLEKVGDFLKAENEVDAYNWLLKRTKHIPDNPDYPTSGGVKIQFLELSLTVTFLWLFRFLNA